MRTEEDIAQLEAVRDERIDAVRDVHGAMMTLSTQLGEALEADLASLDDVGVHADALAFEIHPGAHCVGAVLPSSQKLPAGHGDLIAAVAQ